MGKKLQAADCFIFVTPEYNHFPGMALINTLNHFSLKTWGFKPSGIVSYSIGAGGGVRAAM